MASEIKRRFTDTEMQIARETDLPELLAHLGYQVRRIGRYHTTAEMDSLRIKDRRTWFRYSQNTGGDAITFLQQFCGKSFSEAVEYLLTFHGKARDAPVPQPKPVSRKQEFSLPPRNADDRRVFAYLRKRGIAAQVIRQFLNADTKNPVANAAVALHKNNSISIRLPNSRLLDYADQTTVTVQLVKDKSAVPDMSIAVTDKNDNYAADETNKAGQITVPTGSGVTNEGGKVTTGYEDADGDRWTLTVKVIRTDTKRPISGSAVSIVRLLRKYLDTFRSKVEQL